MNSMTTILNKVFNWRFCFLSDILPLSLLLELKYCFLACYNVVHNSAKSALSL